MCLAVSLAVHAGLTGIMWLEIRAAPTPSHVTLVQLAAPVEPVAVPAPEEESGVPQPADRDAAPRAEDTPALPAIPDSTAVTDTRIASLEAARDELRGQVDALTTETADLSARLDVERARAAELERRLEENREAEQARLARVRRDYDDIVTALQSEIADKVIALDRAHERLTLTIVDRVLFPSGQAELTPEGRQVMARVGQALARASERGILVEGHTDDVPIGPELRERHGSGAVPGRAHRHRRRAAPRRRPRGYGARRQQHLRGRAPAEPADRDHPAPARRPQ
jgi:flagellar motor protein MotB